MCDVSVCSFYKSLFNFQFFTLTTDVGCKATDAFWLEKYLWLNSLLLIHISFFHLGKQGTSHLLGAYSFFGITKCAWLHFESFPSYERKLCIVLKKQLILGFYVKKANTAIANNLLLCKRRVAKRRVSHVKEEMYSE